MTEFLASSNNEGGPNIEVPHDLVVQVAQQQAQKLLEQAEGPAMSFGPTDSRVYDTRIHSMISNDPRLAGYDVSTVIEAVNQIVENSGGLDAFLDQAAAERQEREKARRAELLRERASQQSPPEMPSVRKTPPQKNMGKSALGRLFRKG